LRNRPTLGDAVFFVLSIRAEKALSLAKNLTPGDAHLSDLGLVQGLPRNADAAYIQIVGSPKLAFYRCPGCNEMVDGQKLSEVLEHHQHVLNPYRFLISRVEGNAHMKSKPKRI
jgi:hypothetical protein